MYYYFQILKNFFKAGIILKNCEDYEKRFNLDAVFIDHCTYLNGIMFSFFAKKKITIYTSNYPFSIFKINFKKNKNPQLFKYENVIKYHQKKNLLNKDIPKCKRILNKITFLKLFSMDEKN